MISEIRPSMSRIQRIDGPTELKMPSSVKRNVVPF
jgi:hypothetical protein